VEHHGVGAEVEGISIDHKLDNTHTLTIDVLKDDGDECSK